MGGDARVNESFYKESIPKIKKMGDGWGAAASGIFLL